MLLDAGADHGAISNGKTPLCAAEWGRLGAVRVLVMLGRDQRWQRIVLDGLVKNRLT